MISLNNDNKIININIEVNENNTIHDFYHNIYQILTMSTKLYTIIDEY